MRGATASSSWRDTQRTTWSMVVRQVAAAYRYRGRTEAAPSYQNESSRRSAPEAVWGAWAMAWPMRQASSKSEQERSGDQKAPRHEEAPVGSKTWTRPPRFFLAGWVASSTSSFTETESTGPSHSSTAGMATPVVLADPAGPKTITECWASVARAPWELFPRITRPLAGAFTRRGRRSPLVAQVAPRPARGSAPAKRLRQTAATTKSPTRLPVTTTNDSHHHGAAASRRPIGGE